MSTRWHHIQNCGKLEKPTKDKLCVQPRECLVSGWSDWALQDRSHDVPASRDILTRDRKIVQLPRGDGDPCPPLVETKLVNFEEMRNICSRYTWASGRWSDCNLPLEGDTCGVGFKTRINLCLRVTDGAPVSSWHCEPPAPEQVEKCEQQCPQQCAVSLWGEWGPCLPHRCKMGRAKTKEGYRTRSREVLRDGEYGGDRCPHLTELQPCDYPSCYHWRVERSGDCNLKYSDMQCGHGRMNRTSDCINSLETVVSSRFCYDSKPIDTEDCYIPCENDCVTSSWTTWSTCSRSCGVRRQAGFRMRKKVVLAEASSGGTPCLPSRMLRETEKCNEFPCTRYYWQATPWSSCKLGGERTCGQGVQERDVHCYKEDGHKVNPKRCPIEERLHERKNCTVLCARPCRASGFTDWTACPVTCYTEETIEQAHQQRFRFVLEPSEVGGAECPELRHTRACPNVPRCAAYRWQIASWSECTFPQPYAKSGTGLRAREVLCMQDDNIVPGEFCIAQLGRRPALTEPCTVLDTDAACTFSEWSEWGMCTRRCGGHRVRTRTMEGYTDMIAECYDKGQYPLMMKESCPCQHYSAQPMGQWGHCVLEAGLSRDQAQEAWAAQTYLVTPPGRATYCGIGRRRQAIICQGERGENVSAAICGQQPFMEEMCFQPCPRDCKLSQWSEWSKCHLDDHCGNGHQNRSRYVIESDLDGGRQCPHLVSGEEHQSQPCHVECGHYVWVTGEWGECAPLSSLAHQPNCGAGFQHRTVRCMKRVMVSTEAEVEPEEAVDDSLCDPVMRPAHDNTCHTPCPGQCVVTQWSTWTAFPKDCDPSSQRTRTRSVVRQPAEGSGMRCPHLVDMQDCVEEINCFRYDWHWSPWSACVLDRGALCGHGRRLRHVECIRGGLHRVPHSECDEQLGQPLDALESSCEVPCPVDCVVSQWSPWTPCNVTCGLGLTTRQRSVLIDPAHRGRKCPEPLLQWKPCAFTECYHWEPTQWSICTIQLGSCGYGHQTRDFLCLRHDREIMDISYCADQEVPHVPVEHPCFIPCAGDCHVSEWSSWGPCHRPCTPSGDEVGKQVRSRSVTAYPRQGGETCPQRLWESRFCSSGPCVTYSWHASPWFGDRRQVWCESSDGIKVTGGCSDLERPVTLKTCDPVCVGAHVQCQDVNTCGCDKGFRSVHDEAGVFTGCLKTMATTKNQTKNSDMKAENMALYFPQDGPTNFWMYAVIAAGTAFIIFVAVALYTVCRHTQKERQQPAGVKEATSGATMRRRSTMCSTNGLSLAGGQTQLSSSQTQLRQSTVDLDMS